MKKRRDPLNEFPFTCKTCLTHFPIAGTRIRAGNCTSCAIAAGFIATSARQPANDELCANCAHPFGHRRVILRADSQKVHYRCPTVSRSERIAARAAPS